jgi:putative tryptophan/tyrosine transport system substrate-binding protein
MKRREFITLLGGAAASWPLVARAQQPNNLRRVDLLPIGYRQTDPEGEVRVTAFLDTFRKLGWTDGRNVRVEVRWLSDETDQIGAETKALVESAPNVIVISSNAAVAALQKLDRKIPAVFVQVSDPVGSGFVSSLSRPDGNITGFQNFEPAMGGKWLGLLKEVAPGIARAAVIVYPDTAVHSEFLRAAEAVAPSLGVEVSAIKFRNRDDIARDIAEFAATPNGGLIVLPHPGNIDMRALLTELTARLHLPAIYPFRYFAASGGLMSYGFDQTEQWRAAAGYVDRILRGGKPAELPVQAPTKYDLVINLKSAHALGLTLSSSLLASAVELID